MTMFSTGRILGLAVFAVAALGGAALAQSGAYTEAQAQRGDQAYQANCALCHGPGLSGGPGAPTLAGPEFGFGWKDKSAGELFDYVKANMPPGGAGSLSDKDYADIVARIMKANGAPAGDKELPVDPGAMKSVAVVAK